VATVANRTNDIDKESIMMMKSFMVTLLTASLFLPTGLALAADRTPADEKAQAQKQEQEQIIYGSQLLTQQERNEYRTKMRSAKTAEEREQVRKEHHEAMQERGKARGVALPDEPPVRGGGIGPGPGMGPGGGRGR
jgi:hypothetical protein